MYRIEVTQAEALLASGLILPVLDGLDEIPELVRGSAISRIDDALRPGEQLVATYRIGQYRDAVRSRGGLEVTFRAAPAVQLHPLEVEIVRAYLGDDAAGPMAKALRRLRNDCEPKSNQNPRYIGTRTRSQVSFGSSAIFMRRKLMGAERTKCVTSAHLCARLRCINMRAES